MTTRRRFVLGILIAGVGLLASLVAAQDAHLSPGPGEVAGQRAGLLGIAAALAMGLSVMGAAYAVGRIGSAAGNRAGPGWRPWVRPRRNPSC